MVFLLILCLILIVEREYKISSIKEPLYSKPLSLLSLLNADAGRELISSCSSTKRIDSVIQ